MYNKNRKRATRNIMAKQVVSTLSGAYWNVPIEKSRNICNTTKNTKTATRKAMGKQVVSVLSGGYWNVPIEESRECKLNSKKLALDESECVNSNCLPSIVDDDLIKVGAILQGHWYNHVLQQRQWSDLKIMEIGAVGTNRENYYQLQWLCQENYIKEWWPYNLLPLRIPLKNTHTDIFADVQASSASIADIQQIERKEYQKNDD